MPPVKRRNGEDPPGRLRFTDGPCARFCWYAPRGGVATRVSSREHAERLLRDGCISEEDFAACYAEAKK